MGKPYRSEIEKLPAVYGWARALENTALRERIQGLSTSSLIAIGSGGSQSLAALAADLHQVRFGQVARADTPLSSDGFLKHLKSSATLVISAGGRNPDILGIAKAAVRSESKSLIALCGTKNSPLARLVNGYSKGFCFDFKLPTGKDGFLATNSLMALGVIVLRSYGCDLPRSYEPAALQSLGTAKGTSHNISRLLKMRYMIALHGSQSKSAAIDVESKLVEAGLVSVQLADYRNFAHGRHHWLAKNPDSGVLAIATAEEENLARRTLKLLPATVPCVLIASPLFGYEAWAGLQATVFDLVAKFGDERGIDPGRPGVPEFGRRIYHLNAFRRPKIEIRTTAINRKKKAWAKDDSEYLKELERRYSGVCDRFQQAKFRGLVLDYDGTMCDHSERFLPLSEATGAAVNRIIEAGFLLGVATGRGKSVREVLQAAVPKRAWQQVKIGYYNGGVVADLADNTQPRNELPIDPCLLDAKMALAECSQSQFAVTVRPYQITVESPVPVDIRDLWSRVTQRLEEAAVSGIKVLASTRSVDVVPEGTTKRALVRALECLMPGAQFLCIGDRPCWPGNDAQLLSQPFSLSVDEVDGSPWSAWNMAPAGVLGAAALRFYLSHIEIRPDHFSILLGCS